MNKWLPSRKTRMFFGVLAIIIVGLFLITQGSKFVYKSDGNLVVSSLVKNISEKDSDKDGLKDWEEDLWKTDPQNPDTDGDGILDGDEKLEEEINFLLDENETKDLTETDLFSKMFLTQYLELKKNNNVSEESVSVLLTDMIEKSVKQNYLIGENLYNLEDLTLISSEDEFVLNYERDITDLIKRKEPFFEGKKYNLVIVEDFLEKRDPSVLLELEYASVIYEDIREELVGMKVPSDVAEYHLGLLNGISNIYLIIKGLSEERIFSDPVVILTRVKNYTEYEEAVIDSYTKIMNYLN